MLYGFFPTNPETIDELIDGNSPPYPGPTEDVAHHGGNIQDRIDPSLSTMDDAPMQQYLQDSHAPMFNVQPRYHVHFQTVEHDPVSSPQPQSQGRHGSPFSQHQPSLASSAQSPQTESDQFYEGTQGPSTPPDMRSPFTHVYEAWDTSLLTGLSSLTPTDRCVNPSDIHPSQVRLDEFYENVGSEESTLEQGPSFDGSNPSAHYQGADVTQQPSLPVSNPANGSQHGSSLAPVYPDPEAIDEITNSVEEVTIEPRSRTAEEPCTTEGSRTADGQVYRLVIARGKPSRATNGPSRRGRPRRSDLPAMTGASKVTKTGGASRGLASRRLPASNAINVCRECNISFKDAVTFQKHTKTQHKRAFTCVFHFAGCADAFANKNEWKRHVQSQHMNFHFWLCTHDACGSVMSQDYQVTGAPTHGRPFRRKDLFTQHVRRMHPTSPSSAKTKKSKYAAPDRDDQLKKMQDDAFRKRCELPRYMCCPAQECDHEFHGQGAWNDRMEHVARHLERAASNDEPPVQFGGLNDDTLIGWAASEDVKVIYRDESRGWQLCQPLKNAKVDLKSVPGCAMDADQDAEGEDCI
ncbi:hypothetical protein QQX98_005909 [Neonectria punicea]|uniref:C2H2-type domain-containing protein n=1 Tax=Neonectria punicea TaxID=979145 RepID=A0ABR1H2U0_9HYPO